MKMSEEGRRRSYAAKVSTTMCSLLLHAMCITLKDPKVMGKNTFGYARLEKFAMMLMENFNEMLPAFWIKNPTRGYDQERILKKLAEVYASEKIEHFEDVFPYCNDIKDYTPDLWKVKPIKEYRK